MYLGSGLEFGSLSRSGSLHMSRSGSLHIGGLGYDQRLTSRTFCYSITKPQQLLWEVGALDVPS